MRTSFTLAMTILLGVVTALSNAAVVAAAAAAKLPPGGYRGLHLISHRSDAELESLRQQLPDLAKMGINLLILEVNYAYQYQSHPELRAGEE